MNASRSSGMKARRRVEIVIEQLLAQVGRQIGLGVVQKRGDVVLQRAFAAALVIEKEGLAVAQHDVARLEIAIEKVVAGGAQQEFRQAAEIVFQRLLVEGNAGEPEKVILEIIQIPGDGLAVEAGARIADFVIQIAAGFDLKARQHGDNFAIGLDRLGSDVLAGTIGARETQRAWCRPGLLRDKRPGSNPRRRSPAPAGRGGENAGKIRGRRRSPRARHRECRWRCGCSPESRMIFASRAAELALQRLHPLRRRVEMLLKKFFENVHGCAAIKIASNSLQSSVFAGQGREAKIRKSTHLEGRFVLTRVPGPVTPLGLFSASPEIRPRGGDPIIPRPLPGAWFEPRLRAEERACRGAR